MADKKRVPESLRQQVRARAHGYCEFCLVHEDDVAFSYHADHVIAEQHHGETKMDNLAWTCNICNHFKGTNLSSIDPLTKAIVPLFNPRKQQWKRHFCFSGVQIEPLTTSGRATTELLQFNSQRRITQRTALMSIGHFPPIKISS